MIGRLGGGLGAVGVTSALSADESPSHYGGKAKRVIQLFMNGGPYQGDLFDPKPALKKFEGQRPDGATLRTERITGGLLPSIRKFAPRGNSGVVVSDLLPEICTLDCGTMNFGAGNYVMTNTVDMLRVMAKGLRDLGVKPEVEVFDFGHLWFAKQLLEEGLLDPPPL